MNLLNIFRNVFNEEKLPEGKTGILLLDIDDTLLKSDPSVLRIYRKLPTDKKEVALTSAEYAKEHVTPDNKKYYDYRDFNDPAKVYASIYKGAPLLNNLRVVDAFYNGGYDLGILTARGCADAVRRALKDFLKVKDENGNLIPVRIAANNVHCVNDKKGSYPGDTDFEKKQNILRKYAKDYNYDYVYFIDDDAKNLNALKALKKSDPEIAERLRSIDAKKNMAKPIKEEVISEMAVKDVTSEVINAVNSKDYGKALALYFNIVKNQPAYAGKKDVKSAFKHMLTFGIARTFSSLEKKGQIPEGATQEMKAFGISNIDKLVDGIEYEGNPDYVAKKRNITTERKKVAAKTVDALKKGIEKYKADGWTIKDETPKEGSTKEIPHFFYVYATRPKQIFESVEDGVLVEMAMKDVSPDVLTDIKNKNYKDALIKYFNSIKDQATYAKFDTVAKAYDQLRRYGLARTFNAFEKNGKIEPGAAKELKAFADDAKNRAEILATLGGDDAPVSKETAPKKEKGPKPEKEEPKNYEGDAGALRKIKDRINKYGKLINSIDDYVSNSRFITPFAVDMDKNGESGVPLVEKPLVSGIAKNNPYLSKSERYAVPMKEFREKFIPDFIEKAAMKELTDVQERNLKKAESLGSEYYEATKNKILGAYMSKFLNNIVMGLNDFNKEHKDGGLTDKQILDELKTEVDFPYSEFVKLERWFKENKIARDKKADSEKAKTSSSAAVPKEVEKIKGEYISYLNALEKAIADDKASEFFSNPANAEIAYVILSPDNKPTDSKKMQAFKASNPVPSDKLSPTLKQVYKERVDENKDEGFAEKYSLISGSLRKLIKQRNEILAKGGEVDWKTDANIETLAKKVIEATMDRLIAVDLIDKAAASGVLRDLEAASKKHEAIKQKYAEAHPEAKADEKKYDEYYTPDESGESEAKKAEENPLDTMYKAIQASVDKLPFPELAKRRLVPAKGVNLAQKKYTEDEVKELYDALKQGDEKLYELLATDKFRTTRVG